MKRFVLNFFILMMLFVGGVNYAQTAGFNTTYAVVSINGGANSYYDLQAVTANPDFEGANLGSFNTTNALTLKGAEHNVFKCGGCDLTSTRLYYRVYATGSTPGSFSNVNIGFTSGGANGCGGEDQQWSDTGNSINILSGLVAGNYTFEVYSDASVTCLGGTVFAGNFGANYKANFTYCGAPTGPLTAGNYSIPGCFPTVASAVTYLNANGVSGAGTIQFDVAAGHTETAPATGILLNGVGTPGNLATGTATTPIVFKKNGSGANPKITAPLWAAGGNTNGIVKIIGGDYITFDGFTLEENPGNTVTATGATNTMTELGFGLHLGSGTNGARNNTIKNCTITLNANFPNSIGIFSSSSSSATNTALAASSSAGTNSFNAIESNTISGVAYGIYFICQPNTAAVTETGNVFGGSSAGLGNTITFGNATVSTAVWSRFSSTVIGGIVYRNGANMTAEYNSVTSLPLVYAQSICSGITVSSGTAPVGVVYSASISNNIINLISNGPTVTSAIDFGHGLATTTHTANNNTIYLETGSNVATTLSFQAIRSAYTSGDNVISGNTISISQPGAGPFTAASYFINANGRKNNLTLQSNVLQSVTDHIKTTNIIYGIAHNGGVNNSLLIGGSPATANTINIQRNTSVSANNFAHGIVGTDDTSNPASYTISHNLITLSNLTGTSTGMGIYNYEGNPSTVKTISNNTVSVSGTNTGVSNGLFLSNGIITASNNTIDVSTAAISIAGIDFTINGTVNQAFADSNSITLTTTAENAVARGIGTSLVNVLNGFSITNNTINSITATATNGNPVLVGIRASQGTNNVISGNTIKDISTGVGSGDAFVFGIDVSGLAFTPTISGNNIYNLQSSFSGINSAVNGINVVVGASTYTMYNNFISDLRAPFASSNTAVNGIACGATNSVYRIYYNTIKLGSSTPLSGGANFGVKGIAVIDDAATTVLDLRNNIIHLNATPSGSGYAACVGFASGTSGIAPAGFATSSNNNVYHINSNAANYLFAQGSDATTIVNGFALSGLTANATNNIVNDTNFNASCGYYKTFVGGTLDSATYTEDNITAGSTVGTFIPSGNSFAENGAQSIASPSITVDFDGQPRTPTNDIGALQFSGTAITYTNPINTASVIITASPSGPIAQNTSVTFTATPTNGGAFPTYQWSVNNAPIPGETDVTFTTTNLIDGDSVTVEMVSDDNCVIVATVVSNAIIIDVIGPYDTNVINPLCGATLNAINQNIFANNIAGAQGYRFRVTDLVTNQIQIIDKQLRVFQLTQLANYAFDRTYKIEVAVRIENVWQSYGLACNVTTPIPLTTLANCNATLALMSDNIIANNVPYATGYRFRITNTTTNAVDIIDRPIRDVRITLVTSPQYNTLYTVEVAVRNTTGDYLPYGSSCNVTTPPVPLTKLIASQCNSFPNLNDAIFANNFVGATVYRFKVENSSLGYSYIFDRPIRTFVLNQVPGLLPGITYDVSVSIEVGTVFGPYGDVCTLTTPGALRTNDTIVDFEVVSYPNPYNEYFALDVTTVSEELIHVRIYDMLGKIVATQSTEALSITDYTFGADLPSGIYNVIVSQGSESKTIRVIKR